MARVSLTGVLRSWFFLCAIKFYNSICWERKADRQKVTIQVQGFSFSLQKPHGSCLCSQLTWRNCWSSSSSSTAYAMEFVTSGVHQWWSLTFSLVFKTFPKLRIGSTWSHWDFYFGPTGSRICPSTEHSGPFHWATMMCSVTLMQLYVCGREHSSNFSRLARNVSRLILFSLLQHSINLCCNFI